jgi:hypothetical protein
MGSRRLCRPVLLLAVIGALGGCGVLGTPTTSLPAAATRSSAAPSTSSPTASAPVAPSTIPTPLPIAAPTVFSGSSDAVVAITKPAGTTTVIATITGNASGKNFDVRGLDGEENRLVATTSPYHGSTLLDPAGGSTTRLRVHASGPWTITLSDPRSAPVFTDGFSGTGDSVLVHDGAGGTAGLDGTGGGTFAVRLYSDGRATDLIRATAPWTGQVHWPAGLGLVAVTATGPWSISIDHRG